MVYNPDYLRGKTRLLIVDDDSDLRLTLCEYMETLRFHVTSAKNGTEAIKLIESGNQFDLIFTDLMMPSGPDGLELLRAARIASPHCYVVVMTGFSSIETAIESIRFGAFDYLTKPFQLAEIEIVANRAVEHLALLDDNRKLSKKVSDLIERFAGIDSRLEKIETTLGRLSAILEEKSKTLTL
jgi:DNA-binding NtrC family response regulator